MGNNSKQTQVWSSEFGVEYTDRNLMTIEEMDAMYEKRYGVSRREMNRQFVGDLPKDIRILEVGSNIGLQLLFLQEMGFKSLYGIELSRYAVELSKSKTKNINIIQGNALSIPFKDSYFDLVFTSGLLIHINPKALRIVLKEIHRCSNSYIWGFEYFAEQYTQIKYREAKETSDLLWKANFHRIFLNQFRDLEIVRAKFFNYTDSENKDVMFLLRKGEK